MPVPLFCQPMLFILAILVAKGASRDYKTIEELFDVVPPAGEMCALQWDENVVRMPFFESTSTRGGPGKISKAGAFSNRFLDLGFRSGYPRPPTMHDFKAIGLFLIGMYITSTHYSSTNCCLHRQVYSEAQRMKHAR